MSQNVKFRVIPASSYHGDGVTDENLLAQARMLQPDKINPVLTYLQGRESQSFPLTFLTEGQSGGLKADVEISNTEYYWDVAGKRTKPSKVISHSYASTAQPGKGVSEILVVMEDNLLKDQHLIVNAYGTVCRIQAAPVKVSNGWLYRWVLNTGNINAYLALNEIAFGSVWTHDGPGVVSESRSFGNESNVTTPGKMKNQISILRKSYHIAGNVSDKMIEIDFGSEMGGKKFMEYEEWQHDIEWKTLCEEHYWYSEYNRTPDGRILVKDPETGLPIPTGAGIIDQIPNKDTYSFLTAEKLDNTVLSVMYGRTDFGAMDIILYTGMGGMREFDAALKSSSAGIQIVGDKFVKNVSSGLMYGGYFVQYKTIEGHTITVKHLPLLDSGPRADVALRHYQTGLPITSYEMYFIDQSTYDGVRNIQMVSQRGRSMIRGMEQGMSLYKGKTFGDYNGNATSLKLATSQDKTSMHVLSAKGVCINRATHCFALLPDTSLAA